MRKSLYSFFMKGTTTYKRTFDKTFIVTMYLIIKNILILIKNKYNFPQNQPIVWKTKEEGEKENVWKPKNLPNTLMRASIR